MLQSERQDFEAQMKPLFAAADRAATPERLEAYWIGLQKMELSTVVRVVEHVLQQPTEGQMKLPSPGQFWAINREMRAARRVAPANPSKPADNFHGDAWDRTANLRLLQHMATRVSRGARYCSERMAKTWPIPEADQETVDLVHAIKQSASGWAAEMREHERAATMPADNGKALWSEYMDAGERAVAYIRTQHAQRAAA